MTHRARTNTLWPLAGLSLLALSGCFFPGGGSGSDVTNTPGAPPAACTATPAAITLCAPGAACAVQSEAVVSCGQPFRGLAIAAGPGGTSAVALATTGRNDTNFHAQFAVLDAAGAGTFRVDPVAPGTSSTTSNPEPHLAAAFDLDGAPAWVTTLGDETLSVRSGGTSERLEDPAGGSAGDPAVVGVAFEPDGTQDVLARSDSQLWLFQRSSAGAWSTQAIDGDGSLPAAITVGADGTRFIVSMRRTPDGRRELYVAQGAGGGALAGEAPFDAQSVAVLAVRGANGASAPVILATGSAQTLFVGDGRGFVSQQFAPAGVHLDDTCPHVATLGDCSCPSACARDGEVSLDATLLRAADGSALVATLVAEMHDTVAVTRNSTETGLGTLTCSCDTFTTHHSLAASRIAFTSVGAGGSLREAGSLPVPADAARIAGAERDGLDVLALIQGEYPSSFRRVVIDPARLQ